MSRFDTSIVGWTRSTRNTVQLANIATKLDIRKYCEELEEAA